jgi:hypothetical protein
VIPADPADSGRAAWRAEIVKELDVDPVEAFPLGGTSASKEIASTGQIGSHPPQSTHSSGWM